MDDDAVFRALADGNRRLLLDRLFALDGQTLGQLCTALPDMTRFGVMKHLAVLEEAHLVTTRKVGREKLHYLNPVPIREVHDRWISKFAEPWAAAMVDLKKELEAETASAAAPAHEPPATEEPEPWPHPVTSSRPTSRPRRSASGRPSPTPPSPSGTTSAPD